MKTFVKALCLFFTILGIQNAQAQDAQLLQLIEGTLDGFNQRSGTAFAAHFAEDVDFISPMGTHMKGKEKIEETYNMLFSKNIIPEYNPWVLSNHSIRYLSNQSALIIFSSVIKEDQLYANGSATALLENGQWSLTSFHLTMLQNQDSDSKR